MPVGANPDISLLLAMLAVGVYWLRRRVIIARGEA
jgi:MYXO-CTERM domain-containing protein